MSNFRCGHPRTVENTYGGIRCRRCYNEYQREYQKALGRRMRESYRREREQASMKSLLQSARDVLAKPDSSPLARVAILAALNERVEASSDDELRRYEDEISELSQILETATEAR